MLDASQRLRSSGTRITNRFACQRVQQTARRVPRDLAVKPPRANLIHLLIAKFFNRALDFLNGAHGSTLRKPLVRASRPFRLDEHPHRRTPRGSAKSRAPCAYWPRPRDARALRAGTAPTGPERATADMVAPQGVARSVADGGAGCPPLSQASRRDTAARMRSRLHGGLRSLPPPRLLIPMYWALGFFAPDEIANGTLHPRREHRALRRNEQNRAPHRVGSHSHSMRPPRDECCAVPRAHRAA